MSEVVLFETMSVTNGKSIGMATLNVEKSLNSLSLEMINLLADRIAVWEKDDNILLVMFQSTGDQIDG